MTGQSVLVLTCAVTALLSYAAVAMSPLPRTLGRQNPEFAAIFCPPLFNFAAEYEDGEVLDFEIGLSRDALRRTIISRHSETGVLVATCGRDPGQPPLSGRDYFVRPSETHIVSDLLAKEVVCLSVPERRMMLIFHVPDNEVREIELTLVNIGL